MLAPELLGPIAVGGVLLYGPGPGHSAADYACFDDEKEREIEMKQLRSVKKIEKIVFPIVVTVFVALLVPSAGALVGSLMLVIGARCGVAGEHVVY